MYSQTSKILSNDSINSLDYNPNYKYVQNKSPCFTRIKINNPIIFPKKESLISHSSNNNRSLNKIEEAFAVL